MKKLKLVHFVLGFVMFVIFILTGQYMHLKYNHLSTMPLPERALFRAGHIYILFIALINISLGTYFKSSKNQIIQKLQLFGSIFLIVSSFLIIYSFFKELPTNKIERIFSRYAIYFALAGILFHSITNFIKNKYD